MVVLKDIESGPKNKMAKLDSTDGLPPVHSRTAGAAGGNKKPNKASNQKTLRRFAKARRNVPSDSDSDYDESPSARVRNLPSHLHMNQLQPRSLPQGEASIKRTPSEQEFETESLPTSLDRMSLNPNFQRKFASTCVDNMVEGSNIEPPEDPSISFGIPETFQNIQRSGRVMEAFCLNEDSDSDDEHYDIIDLPPSFHRVNKNQNNSIVPKDAKKWNCSLCTLENKPENIFCDACQNPKDAGGQSVVGAGFTCKHCTFINDNSSNICEMCQQFQ